MILNVNYRRKKKAAKNTDMWRLNDTLLNNEEVGEEIRRETKTFLEIKDNKNKTTQNLWDAANQFLRGKFTAIQSYLKKHIK